MFCPYIYIYIITYLYISKLSVNLILSRCSMLSCSFLFPSAQCSANSAAEDWRRRLSMEIQKRDLFRQGDTIDQPATMRQIRVHTKNSRVANPNKQRCINESHASCPMMPQSIIRSSQSTTWMSTAPLQPYPHRSLKTLPWPRAPYPVARAPQAPLLFGPRPSASTPQLPAFLSL